MLHFSRIFKIREGKLDTLLEWLNELDTNRKAEALDTLKEENASRETFVLFSDNKTATNYLVGFNESKGDVTTANKDREINQKHKQVKKDCLEAISEPGSIILDLKI